MPHKTEDFTKEHVLAHGISVVCGYSEEKRLNLNHMDCQDLNDITVQDVLLKYTGRMLKVSVNLQMVCTGKKIAFGVVIQEKDGDSFITRGIRVCELEIPEDKNKKLSNVSVDDFCFTFPEWDLCSPRTFKIIIIAHYLFPVKNN